jgi:hypothetical protein
MTAVIEQWRETLAQAHQNAGSGIDIEAVLSMALLPSVTPQNGNADSEVIAGSNTSFVAAFEDKPKRNKAKYQCPGCGAAVWGKAGLNIHCGDCEQAFREISASKILRPQQLAIDFLPANLSSGFVPA